MKTKRVGIAMKTTLENLVENEKLTSNNVVTVLVEDEE